MDGGRRTPATDAGPVAARLAAAIRTAGAGWATTAPWPHLVVDDVLDPELVTAAATEAAAYRGTLEQSSARGFLKAETADPVGAAIAEILRALASPEVTAELAALTGAADLAADGTHRNAGLFVNGPGTFHRPHYDFSHHPVDGRWHRANVLVYLTDWPAERGGELQLWPAPPSDLRPVTGGPTTVTPRIGRVVVMETSRRALHGVTPVRCPPDEARLTLSTRFYSASPPRHRARWNSDATRPRLASEPLRMAVPSSRDLCRWVYYLGRSVPATLRSKAGRPTP